MPTMSFNRSFSLGFGGAAVLSIASWLIMDTRQVLTGVSAHLFLSLGLNPREQGLWCELLFITLTSKVGFIV